MTSRNPSHQGVLIDKLRGDILGVLAACRRQEKRLTTAGIQCGHIHFKSDRPNSMFVLEPAADGKRIYMYVGVDPKKQASVRSAVDRWEARDRLRRSVARLEADLRNLDYEIDSLTRRVFSVHKFAVDTVTAHLPQLPPALKAGA